ncbi:MAG: hypothetical protein ACO3A4_06695 [Silvanigrellaceae bacterium]
MADNKFPDNNEQEGPFGSEPSAKVLPFRKPAAIQTTLPRRKPHQAGKSGSAANQTNHPAKPWKGRVAQFVQLALLVLGVLLALKNCGKL